MSTDPWALLYAARTVLVVHAHPDDETLSTGALLADLAARGTRVVLLTATRGEEGEIVPGAVDPADPRPLAEIRDDEVAAATSALGIPERHQLGTAPALAAGAAPRIYRDSGMRWIREGLAGPAVSSGEDAFTRRPEEDAVADLLALLDHVRPEVVIGYDDDGTYGHPDHVHAHRVTAAACARAGLPMLEIASGEEPSAADEGAAGFSWREHPGVAASVRRAAEAYRTQFTVLGEDPSGDGTLRIRHVGGQDDAVRMLTGLRVRC